MEKAIILLVEDDDLTCATTKIVLEQNGYVVISFCTTEEAVLRIRDGLYYDVLLSDLSFGDDNEQDVDVFRPSIVDVFRASREMMPEAPMVVLSGYGYVEYRMHFADIEPDGYINKAG